SSPLSSTPTTVGLTIPLGEQRVIALQIRNNQPQALTPLVYIAQPDSAPSALRVAAAPLRATLPFQRTRLDPQIASAAQNAADGQTEFIVYLGDQADLSAALTIQDWATRGEYVYRTLTEQAQRTQAALRAELTRQGISYRPLWIANALLVRGTPAAAQALADRSEVALVQADQSVALPEPPPSSSTMPDLCSPDAPTNPVCWNIRSIGADRVWHEFGVNGRGVSVAAIDTGAFFEHQALVGNYRGTRGAGVFDHNYNWYDPHGSQAAPFDQVGHGTHVLGTFVGAGDGTSTQPSIGVAPGAQWVAAQGCTTQSCAESDLIAAAQWILAPTDLAGGNPRPDLRPMVVNNSWAGPGGDSWYRGYIAAWRAAGIFPVFAAGNVTATQPAVCGSVGSPADDPLAVAVGAVDTDGAIASFSLRGPAYNGQVKPDLAAPGTYRSGQSGIYSAYAGSSSAYRSLQGTSMAAPHVAGVIALIWAANPALIGDFDATYAILTGTAQPIPDMRCDAQPITPNNVYGYGRLDAFAAVTRARVSIPWLQATTPPTIGAGASTELSLIIDTNRLPGPGNYQARIQVYPGNLSQTPLTIPVAITVPDDGRAVTLTGRVTAAQTGTPLVATVGLEGGLGVSTDSDGRYILRLLPGTRSISAQAIGYISTTQAVSIGVGGQIADIALTPDLPKIAAHVVGGALTPTLASQAQTQIMVANSGTSTLNYQIYIPAEAYGIWRSDEPDGPSAGLRVLPADAPRIALDPQGSAEVALPFAFPIYDKNYTSVFVNAHGVISFERPIDGGSPLSRCMPDGMLYFYAIAALNADLDPTRGGQIRAAALPSDGGFVVSYEQIPLRTGPATATSTFQITLLPDGRIELRYGDLAPAPGQAGVGVQRQPGIGVELACGSEIQALSRLNLELRPQPASNAWLQSSTSIGALSAGAASQVVMQVQWIPPGRWPYRGRALIVSSDPIRPTLRLTIESRPPVAPYTMLMPQMVKRQGFIKEYYPAPAAVGLMNVYCFIGYCASAPCPAG
ncbi:MAG: S8 family serine peptidase, partial [Roseiflexaceae bacterium]|nr:S8 family serine peptidase [Roseiflexaceae bacterium]